MRTSVKIAPTQNAVKVHDEFRKHRIKCVGDEGSSSMPLLRPTHVRLLLPLSETDMDGTRHPIERCETTTVKQSVTKGAT